MDQHKKSKLMKRAMDIRISGLKMVQKAHSGHIGGAFSMSEKGIVLSCQKDIVRWRFIPHWR